MSGAPKTPYRHGKVCPRHPELDGERYAAGGCTACTKERKRNYEREKSAASTTRRSAQLRAIAAAPARDEITAKIEREVRIERRQTMTDVRREERRRQLLREEGGKLWRR